MNAHPLIRWQVKPKSRGFRFSLGTLLIVVTIFSCYVGYETSIRRSEKFDEVAWKDPLRIEQGVRLKMADGLIRQAALNKLTLPEVIEMLGQPPRRGLSEDPNRLSYWLGNRPGFVTVGGEWLVVRIGPDGLVESVEIYPKY